VQSKATTVQQYLSELPAERREAIQAVREVILKNLDKDFEEGMTYGMIGYYVPHRVYPAGYHCDPRQPLPFAGLASQKNHMAVYLMCIYGGSEDEKRFRAAWAKTGKKLDMGKCCIRFKKLDDLALDLIGESIRRVPVKTYIERYEAVLRRTPKKTGATSKARSPKTSRSRATSKWGKSSKSVKTARKKA
jgi:uncharacterized protein YdhG (YjbR/CyaY superfamily)